MNDSSVVGNHIKVLLVEDNPGDARLIQTMLSADAEEQAPQIVHVESNAAAVQSISQQPFSLILLDLNLPDSQGSETINKLAKVAGEIPIIVLTSIDDDKVGNAAIEAGAEDFLAKDQVNHRSLRRALRYARTRHSLKSRIRNIIEHNIDPTFVVNQAGQILFKNKATIDMFGKPAWLHSTGSIEKLLLQAVDSESKLDFLLFDGEHHIFTSYTTGIEWTGDKNARLCQLHDITSHEHVQMLLERDKELLENKVRERTTSLVKLNRALRTLSACNKTLIHAVNEQDLLQAICNIIIELGEYAFAWVGYAQFDDNRTIQPMAWAGQENGYLTEVEFNWKESEIAMGSPGAAICQMQTKIQYSLVKPDSDCTWHAEAVKRGYQSMIALPLVRDKKAFGVLSIYSSETDIFNSNEVELLEEMASDLAFGIEIIQTRLQNQYTTEQLNRFRAALDSTADSILLVDAYSLNIIDVNMATLNDMGYSNDELLSMSLQDLSPKYQGAELLKEITSAMKNNHGLLVTLLRAKDGTDYIVEMKLSTIQVGGSTVLVISARDITERRHAEMEMTKLSTVVKQVQVGVMITTPAGIIEYANPAYEAMTGFSLDEMHGNTPRIFKSGQHDNEYYEKMWQSILDGNIWREMFVNRRKDGSLFYEEKTITPLRDENGKIVKFISTGMDITSQIQSEDRIHSLVNYDPITDLPNRSLFYDRLDQVITRAQWNGRVLAILLIDIDKFGSINESLGHEQGDNVLRIVADRLVDVLRDGDTVARLSSDEFAVLVEDMSNIDDIRPIIRKIQAAFNDNIEVAGSKLFLTFSIGVACYPDDGQNSDELLRNAEAALHRAKTRGRGVYQFYKAEFEVQSSKRITIEADLRSALDRDEYRILYQPKIDLKSGAMVGVEALLRWQHPQHGMVSPLDFIPLLEENGLIIPVGQWILEQSCRQQVAWLKQGIQPLKVAVNVSPVQFQHDRFLSMVRHGIESSGIDTRYLELELTESVLMKDVDSTLKLLNDLCGLGISLAIDDFGTGYSSLSYLTQYPLHTLKIDRAFIKDIPGNKHSCEISRMIITLAHGLNMIVVAEGVEDDHQRAFLQQYNCEQAQGYMFSKPVSADEIVTLSRSFLPAKQATKQ